jgi:hypothetical protein
LTYFSLGSGILALGIEVFVGLSLMEMPPFGKGGSDIVWAFAVFRLDHFCASAAGVAGSSQRDP